MLDCLFIYSTRPMKFSFPFMPWLLGNSEKNLGLNYRNHISVLACYFCFYIFFMAPIFYFNHHILYMWFKGIYSQIIPQSPKTQQTCSTPTLSLSSHLISFPPNQCHSSLFLKRETCFSLGLCICCALPARLFSPQLLTCPFTSFQFSQKSTYQRGYL